MPVDDSFIDLQEVEPSPVEEKEAYFPPTPARPTTNTIGLSHSVPWYLSRIQKYSSYAFTAFAAAHITNTSIIPLITRSVPASESYLLLTRPYYQGIPAEPILIIVPLWAHVLSGLGLRWYRYRQNAKRYGGSSARDSRYFDSRFLPDVSNISRLGFLFTPLLLGHAFINRVAPRELTGGSSNVNLSYVSHAFARHPIVSSVGFTALITIGCFHMTWGWAKWLALTPDQAITLGQERTLEKKRRWYAVNGAAVGATLLWMAGAFGVIARGGAAVGWAGKNYDEMYRSIPIIGRWM